jgi:hypothetical protein
MAVKQIPSLTPVVFLSPSAQLEIVQDGTTYRASAGQIAAVAGGGGGGGLPVVNDITSPQAFFPIYLDIDQGTPSVIYASNPHYQYFPQEGRLSAFHHESTQGIHLNSNVIALSYTLPAGDNGLSAGPLTVASGVVITVNPGTSWAVV